MPVFVGAGTSSFMKGSDGVGMSTATTTIRNALSGVRPGQMIFNHSTNLMEYYNGTAWIAIDTPPTVTSVNNTNILSSQIAAGFDLVITGTFFASGATVQFIGNNGTSHNSPSVAVNSTTQITARVHSSVSNSNEPYDVKVTNQSGLSSTLEDAFNVNAAPVWSTSAGTLATILDTATGNHVTVSATDPESDTVTYSETASVLTGAGLSLNSSTGVIGGDPNNIGDSSTTISFTLRATSSGSNTTDRNFNIVINPGSDGSSSVRAASNAAAIYATGNRTNGYYWIKGDGTRAARLMYCILDAQWGGGGGWMIVANHDGAKEQHQGHQPRVTARTDQIGSDDGSGNPGQSSMVPEKSFSVDMVGVPYTKFMHMAYPSSNMSSISTSNWLQTAGPSAYYAASFNSSQTIPTTVSYTTADFNNSGLTLTWGGSNRNRRLNYTAYGYSWIKAFAVASANSGGDGTFRLNGSSASTADYPVWIAYHTLSGSVGSGTFSFTDSGSGGTQSSTGFDDFQDGSGMGDGWQIEGQGNNFGRGLPSLIALQ
tara:strand:- start:198 stop:1820 length:1623 start_codon:yes stop_codon:yes gene_type:complete